MAKKSFLVENHCYDVVGISEDDTYLQSIGGRFEPKFQRFCSTLPSDAVVMDIGANIGVTSMILGHYLPKGQIFAVEPGKNIFALLEQNLKASGLQQVMPLNYAVSNETGILRFIEASAYGHLDASGPPPAYEHDEHAVRAYTLDDLVDQLKLERLDLIKVDVEGFEPQVFEGARKTLARFDPIVYFELNSWCLIAHGGHDPIEFMRKIVGDFRFVGRVNKDAESEVVLDKAISSDLARKLIHDNIALRGSVDDVVVASDESRLDPQLFVDPRERRDREREALQLQLHAAQAEQQQLSQRLQAADAERDQLKRQLDRVLNSRSWRYTRFLRSSSRGPTATNPN